MTRSNAGRCELLSCWSQAQFCPMNDSLLCSGTSKASCPRCGSVTLADTVFPAFHAALRKVHRLTHTPVVCPRLRLCGTDLGRTHARCIPAVLPVKQGEASHFPTINLNRLGLPCCPSATGAHCSYSRCLHGSCWPLGDAVTAGCVQLAGAR